MGSTATAAHASGHIGSWFCLQRGTLALLGFQLVLVLGGRCMADEQGVGIDGDDGRLAKGKT